MVQMSVPKTEKKKTPTLAKRRNKWTRDDTELTLLALPTTVWFILFCYLPMFGIILSFKDYKIVQDTNFLVSLLKSEWVGFENFQYFFGLRDFPMILRNTVCYNLVFTVNVAEMIAVKHLIAAEYCCSERSIVSLVFFCKRFDFGTYVCKSDT